MSRSVENIDKELRFFVTRRWRNTHEISRLSGCVVDDTRTIDRLLAERSIAKLDEQMITT